MAAEYPFERQPSAFEGTVFTQGLQGVLRAGRGEAAGRRLERRDAQLVKLHQQYQRGCEYVFY